MRGLAILLAFQFLGLALNKLLHIPLPAPVLGLILFSLALFLGIVKLHWVEETANFLLRHMLLFFAPVIVGTIAYRSILAREWPSITIGLAGSFLIVLLVTGWCATLLMPRGHKD